MDRLKILRRFIIYHITFDLSFTGINLGIRFHPVCTSIHFIFLSINFWHEHNIISKYPYRVMNPRVEAISSIIKEADYKISKLFDDEYADFGGWKVDYVDKIDENKVDIQISCLIHLLRPVDELLIKESVDRAEREYQLKLTEWEKIPWYIKLFPQLNKNIYDG
jgi:hypothetical protein